MNFKKLQIVNFALILLLGLVALPAAVFAKDNIDFTQLGLSHSEKENFVYEIKNSASVEDVLKIENTSKSPVLVKLFAADAKIDDGENFILKDEDDVQEDVGQWITFRENNFTLEPKSSKEVVFSISVPSNADAGPHKGGILMQRILESKAGLGINLQRGVPITINVPEQAIKKAEFKEQEVNDLVDFNRIVYVYENTGTVSLDARVEMVLTNLWGSETIYRKNIEIPRASSEFAQMDWPKPFLAYYSVKSNLIDNDSGEIYASSAEETFIFIPWLELIILAFFILLFVFRDKLKKMIYPNEQNKPFVDHVLVLVFVLGFLTYFQHRFPMFMASELSASTITISDRELSEAEENATYFLVAKWGHLIDRVESEEMYMDADLILSGASMEVFKSYSLEEGDKLSLEGGDRALHIDSSIDDDYDAVALKITTDQNRVFSFAFEDRVRDLVHVYSIPELSDGVKVSTKKGSAYTFGDAELKLLRTEVEMDSYLESNGLKEASGSAGVLLQFEAATPDVASGDPLDKDETIAVLKNILYEEPATPEAETSVDLNSEFVEEIVKSDIASEVLASEEFISDLLATPKVLSLLAATAQSNVVFLPSETITFPKQEFSFEERKVASTVIGTMVFISKKDKPWNAYVSASDFEILAGDGSISVSNLSIVPGPVIPVNNSDIDFSEIRRGGKKRLEDSGDQAVLVTSDADQEGMFVMRPRLELILGPATKPGVYRGELTITYIDKQ